MALGGFEAKPVEFARLPFSHPVFILYSSGTTGTPKCIVHSAGGVLIQLMKEHQLHCDLREGERLFYFTTLGWMMWNWLVAGLSCGATLVLYDGSPFFPDGNVLFDYADEAQIDVFGTSAKWIDSVKKAGLRPRETHKLSSVRMITSTGSPLAPESFDFVYEAIKPDVHLASIAGGTDLCSCFMLGNPLSPVYRGEIQGPGLGMAVDVFDDAGQPMASGKGELVCTKPFTAMPVGFLNDPDGAKYQAAYFERYPGVWHHGDFAEWTEHGGLVMQGRSDATLNPGGVRIGTAEIYRQVEQLDEVKEAIVIGQNWDNDVRVVLFVVLAEGVTLDEALAPEDQGEDPQRRKPPACASPYPGGGRHSAHQIREDHRDRRPRYRARAGGQEQRGAGQSAGARLLYESERVTAIEDPLTPALSPRGEGVAAALSPSEAAVPASPRPNGERDRVRGSSTRAIHDLTHNAYPRAYPFQHHQPARQRVALRAPSRPHSGGGRL